MFALLREARPNATIAIFQHWTGFGRLVESGKPKIKSGVADVLESPGDEDDTMEAAINYLRSGKRPTLLFIHLDHIDHIGHTYTWGSLPYYNAIEKADRLIELGCHR